MYQHYFIVGCIILFAIIAVQLIRLNILSIRIIKNKGLYSAEVKEDRDWQFIKGLY